METQDKRWSEIMQEVDRLYWINQTSEGRINCISDYIIRLLNNKEVPFADITAEEDTARAEAHQAGDGLA